MRRRNIQGDFLFGEHLSHKTFAMGGIDSEAFIKDVFSVN